MSISCSSQYKIEKCPGEKHLFKIVLSDSNYFFEEIENFLVPMKYESGNNLHFDLQNKMMNPKFIYMVNGKEVTEKVQVNFKHITDMCNYNTCWHKTAIKRPINHKKVKDSYKNHKHSWLKCTFSFELKDVENIEFFHKSFLSGDEHRDISVFVNSSQ